MNEKKLREFLRLMIIESLKDEDSNDDVDEGHSPDADIEDAQPDHELDDGKHWDR